MLASPLCERQIKHTAYVSCCQIRIAISAKRLDLSNVTLSLRRDTVIAYKCHQPATAIGTAAKLLPSANYITHGDIFIIVYGCPVPFSTSLPTTLAPRMCEITLGLQV